MEQSNFNDNFNDNAAAGGSRRGIVKTCMAAIAAVAVSVGLFCSGFVTGTAVSEEKAPEPELSRQESGWDLNYTLTSAAYSLSNSTLADGGYASVYKSVKDSVVSINTISAVTYNNIFGGELQERESRGAGSGIIFYEDDEKFYIVTNQHVIDKANSVTVSLDDETQVKAHYIGGDKLSDIAVISVAKTDMAEAGVAGFETAVFGNSDVMEIGNLVMAVGNALGEGKSATEGIVSAINRNINISGSTLTLMQTSAAINAGNSGGPLVNMNGEVIGINTAKLFDTGVEGMGYAIPSNIIMETIDEIMKNGTFERPYMGIGGRTVTEEMVAENNYPSVGVYVSSVERGFAADEAGLKAGDIIISYNGIAITVWDDLAECISNTRVGEQVALEVIRGVYQTQGFRSQLVGTETLIIQATMTNYNTGTDF